MNNRMALGFATTLLCVSGLAAKADAATTYNFTGGYVTLSADIGTTDYLPNGTTIQLTGGQVTFDATGLTIPSFQFADTTASTVALTGTWAGESITIITANVVPGATYSSSATFVGSPPPTYTYTLGNVAASGTYSLSGPITRASSPFANPAGTDTSLGGTLSLGTNDTIQLTGITLGTFLLNGQTVTLKGDVVFEGAAPVPLPASAWLFGSALLTLTVLVRRRRPLLVRNRLVS